MTTKKLIGMVLLMVALCASGQSLTKAQLHFKRQVIDRTPGVFVAATPTNTILRTETQWRGHVLTLEQAQAQMRRGSLFIVSPVTDASKQLPPVTFPGMNMVVGCVNLNGTNIYGVYAVGRKVVIP